MAQKKKLTDFAQRVRDLIDTHLHGNVAAAARELGVSQRSLHDLYVGKTDDPRLTMIQAILNRFPSEDARFILLGERTDDGLRFKAAVGQRALDLAVDFWNDFERDPERTVRRLRSESIAEPTVSRGRQRHHMSQRKQEVVAGRKRRKKH